MTNANLIPKILSTKGPGAEPTCRDFKLLMGFFLALFDLDVLFFVGFLVGLLVVVVDCFVFGLGVVDLEVTLFVSGGLVLGSRQSVGQLVMLSMYLIGLPLVPSAQMCL